MDQHIFTQLDALERSALGNKLPALRPRWNEHGTSSGQDSTDRAHGAANGHEHADSTMNLDQRPFLQPSSSPQHAQAIVSRSEMPLPQDTVFAEQHDPQPKHRHARDLQRSALESAEARLSSSPPTPRASRSNPVVRAIRGLPSAQDYIQRVHHSQRAKPMSYEQHGYYEPLGVEQVEAEERHVRSLQPKEQVQPSHHQKRALPSPGIRSHSGASVVHGISLVSTRDIPDSFCSIFPFPLFNAVQSKSFKTVYNTNDNFVLSSPTGSGKTAILELAICRLITISTLGSYKIVYQAPTKSLCSERHRDWQAKFGPLGLQCAELTGDTEGSAQLRNVQTATIIITTPEKWDSITRKWKDHQKLIQMVKLFLIDEVHILKEDRGATLEAVVSRMKSVGSDIRFVALSATIPNSDDVATWLGKDQRHPELTAAREKFGEEFRPVKLQRNVCGYSGPLNDFAFDQMLNAKLPEVVSKHSQRKPIMVFCFTRKSCAETARLLAEWWGSQSPTNKHWSPPRQRIAIRDEELRDTVSSGVAFHHAGVGLDDRTAVEKAYLAGEINVICCTSTLAVGVNLPCHTVIIKGTVMYAGPGAGCKEYSDLEVMQMLGRAGRPQFDDSAVAVIMTRAQRLPYYEKMITGQEVLESCLHLNLIDHLNSEIGLGTITNASMAKQWLQGTFLYVRLMTNPEHYRIDGSAPSRTLDARLENICTDGIAALEEYNLVQSAPKLHCTEFGDAMARYYLQFDTMKVFLSLPAQSKVSEILSAISQAAEFREIRFRANEKPTYRDLNKSSSIKFPIPVNLDAPAHKVSLIIQSVLGAVELPTEDPKQKNEYLTAKTLIFQHVTRFVKCIIDCQLYLQDSVTIRNALMLSRSLGARVWDDSPLHIKQLESVGLVYVRKLTAAKVRSIEDIDNTEAHRLETIVSRNPPWGSDLQAIAKLFPKLRVSLKMQGRPLIKKGEHVAIKIIAEIGFLNEQVPELFNKRPVYVCLLAERSDGHAVHFARISAKKLNQGQDIVFDMNLLSHSQTVRAFVMCDEVAGTMRHAILKPEIPADAFPPTKMAGKSNKQQILSRAPDPSMKRTTHSRGAEAFDEFGDAGLDDTDLALAEDGAFADIDAFNESPRQSPEPKAKKRKVSTETTIEAPAHRQLANGKWACNHLCKDKTACKHSCCRGGLDKRPKPKPAKKEKSVTTDSEPRQTQLNLAPLKKKVAHLLTISSSPRKHQLKSLEVLNRDRLHDRVEGSIDTGPILGGKTNKYHGRSKQPNLSFLSRLEGSDISDHGPATWALNDLPDADALINTRPKHRTTSSEENMTSRQEIDEDFNMLSSHGGSWPSEPMHESTAHGHTGRGHSDRSLFTDLYNSDQQDRWQLESTNSSADVLGTYSLRDTIASRSNDEPIVTHEQRHDTSTPLFVSSECIKSASVRFGESIAVPSGANDLYDHQKYVPVAQDGSVLASPIPDDLGEPLSNGSDSLQEWFKCEFGTEYFNYIG